MRRTPVRVLLAAAVLLLPLLMALGVGTPAQAAASWPVTQASTVRNGNAMSLQFLLTARGYATTADGSFGAGTRSNLASFQAANGLVADGVAGPLTWQKLVVTVAQGSTNLNAVKAAQTQLNKYGANLVVDGQFGPGTTAAVKAFQRSRGLVEDGSVGPNTWRELLGASQTYDQTQCYSVGGTTYASLTTAQKANAQTIVTTTRAVGGNRNAQIIAVMTAMQESKLCNIQFGDRDSIGLFQQRPSMGWCPAGAACIRPVDATKAFLGVSAYTSNRGLFDVAGWESKSKTLAADAVQRSCCPNAYAKWETLATSVVNAYGG
ncbi:MAG: peptidoglycan-binding protein [Nocardioides sp.]|uniref:peptidoglycan-binding domain-containing protein n=1 Tax=Nocardioides sp. TaxID=35761 RepID=UPI003F009906